MDLGVRLRFLAMRASFCAFTDGRRNGNWRTLRRFSDGMRRPVSSGMRYAPNENALEGARKETGCEEDSVVKRGNEIFEGPKLTVGLDLGDRSSHYCILDEAGNVILEHRLSPIHFLLN